jgi:hypothetical protein
MAAPRRRDTEPPPPRVTASRGGDIVSGRVPERTADPAGLPKLPPSEVNPYRHPFVYLWHPGKWEFLVTKGNPDGEWLPHLTQFYLMPGANRVREKGALNVARPAWTAQGFREIAKHHGPNGDYVRVFDVVMTGKGVIAKINLSAWDHLVMNGEATERVFDKAGHRQWIRDLLAAHVIDPPPRYVAKRLVRQKQARIERLMGLPNNDAVKTRIEKEHRILEKMAASFNKAFGYNPLEDGAEDEMFRQELARTGVGDQSAEEAVDP